ncbi:MAG: PKD domain-containing protein [bacterium]|nr:PKD domain-containing protein [bacterium]
MKKKFILNSILITVCLLIFGKVSPASATVETGVTANSCPAGYGFIDFEEGVDGAQIVSQIPGVQFTTTLGLNWFYGDVRTGNYNARSLTNPQYNYGDYVVNGYFVAWLGVTGDQGRIDFTEGTASYFSLLTSTYSGLTIDAYDPNDNLIATSGWASGNLTGTFTRLTVSAPGMAYVIVHDWGNYWIIDDICTDAPGVPLVYKQVAELTKEVIGADYLWGGKGYYYGINRFATSQEVLEQGYNYYNPILKKIDFGKGIDCSGLNFWSYNRTYSGGETITWETCVNEKKCPLYYEGADGQYRGNTGRIEKDKLKVGDLFFFDVCVTKTGKCDASKKVNDNIADHVAMYIGPFTYEGKEFNTIHASGFTGAVTPAYYNSETEELLTIKSNGINQFLKVYDYGRVAEFKLAMEIIVKSPVNLIVVDPDGQTVDVTNTLLTEDGYTREVNGMSYIIRDVDGDGDIEDVVAIPERKIGNYLIQVVPEPDALPTDTYSLEVAANGQTIVLAKNIPISEIPDQPYQIQSTETEINAAPIPDAEIQAEIQPKPLTEEPDDNYIIEANTFGGANITLDGTASYDPESASLTYSWSDEDGNILGTDEVLNVFLPLGRYQVTLTVSDGRLSSGDVLDITVQDTILPEVEITSPEEIIYLNTQGSILIAYTINDICDSEPEAKVYLDEIEYSKNAIDLGKYSGETEHALKVGATDDSGNNGADSVIFKIVPEAMKSFSIKSMKIHWAFDHPGKHLGNKTSFTISGSFELPDKYQEENLDKSALLYIKIADQLVKDKVNFKKVKNLWLYQEASGKKNNDLSQGADIKTMAIHWIIDKNSNSKRKDQNWFYIRGELSLPELDINALPQEAIITLEIPVAPYGQSGSLDGKEAIEFEKLNHIWSYRLSAKWDHWKDGWWKKID